MTTVLVTGGAGFIGSHIVDELVARGVTVRVLDSLGADLHRGRPAYLRDDLDVIVADLGDAAAVERAVRDIDAVCHQGARVGLGVDFADAPSYVADNTLGTAILLRALHAQKFRGRFVLASSMVVYGEGKYSCRSHGDVRPGRRQVADLQRGRFEPRCPSCGDEVQPGLLREDAPLDPRNVYALTKLSQEHLVTCFGAETGCPVSRLRYHNVYGPRMPRDTPYAGVASIMRSAYAADRAPKVFEDGGQRRDFVHVRDVAHANVRALLLAPDSAVDGAFNIASGEVHTIADMALALRAAYGADAPAPVVTGEFRVGDVRHITAAPQRASDLLGFTARVSFGEGVRAFAFEPLREAVGG